MEKNLSKLSFGISLLALSVASATFYFQFFHKQSSLTAAVQDFTLGANSEEAKCTVLTTLVNSGNVPAAVVGAELLLFKHEREENSDGSITVNSPATIFFSSFQLDSELGLVIQPNSIDVRPIAFPTCKPQELPQIINREGYSIIGMRFYSMNNSGRIFNSEIAFGWVENSPDEDSAEVALASTKSNDLLEDFSYYNGFDEAWRKGKLTIRKVSEDEFVFNTHWNF